MRQSFAIVFASLVLAGCQSAPMNPIRPVERVDLARFMGDWYVIAHIPSFIEREAYNAVERYELLADGTIATTFTFNKGALDGPLKRYEPQGSVVDDTGNAVWGMQFVWPIKAQYVIAYLDSSYSQTIVARDKRDYVWIMARTPQLPADVQASLIARVQEMGYDTAKLRLVPQSGTSESASLQSATTQ